jgi:hypothetical protein
MCHTKTDAQKQAKTKTQPPPQAVLWQPQNHFHHKEKKDKKKFFNPQLKQP